MLMISRVAHIAAAALMLVASPTAGRTAARPWCTGVLLVRDGFYAEPDHYSNVTLSGRMKQKTVQGAPGFGESPKVDDQVPIALLYLDHPVPMLLRDRMSFDPNKAIPGIVHKVQLVGMTPSGKGDPFVDHNPHVAAEGTLYMSDGPLSRADVILTDGRIWKSRTNMCKGQLVPAVVDKP